jgi:hypothetical protein
VPSPPPALHQKTRWTDRLTTALLTASLGVAVGPAAPALLRAAGVASPAAAPSESAAPLALPHRPPEILGHEGAGALFDPDDDEAQISEPHGQLGLTRGPLVLHEHPADAARVVGDVQAGELVAIVRISGDWALVYYSGSAGHADPHPPDPHTPAGSLVLGWARKSEIAIR